MTKKSLPEIVKGYLINYIRNNFLWKWTDITGITDKWRWKSKEIKLNFLFTILMKTAS